MKQYLDAQQAQRLIDMGVDMSRCSMSHRGKVVHYYPETWDWDLTTGSFKSRALDKWYIPTLTIGELIERLPVQISSKRGTVYRRSFSNEGVSYFPIGEINGNDVRWAGFSVRYELIDNLFDCYVQLITDGIIKL